MGTIAPSSHGNRHARMKAIFGLMAIVLVLAIVGHLAKRNVGALTGSSSVVTRQEGAAREAARQAGVAPARDGTSRLDAFPGAAAADPGATVPQVSKGLQQQAVDRTQAALREGARRNERAAP